ncbi:MAG: tetratricopeptide repeat protein, partial [Deltaproteobacteria bacterium]|nr:tetratricopeptide repeat protein [Deltaproteobacteria bacterium]
MTNKNFKTSFMTAFLPTLTALLALLFASACGPMPPEDPFHLAEAKDSLGRGYHWYLRGCNQEALRFFSLGLEEARLSDNVALIVKSLNFMGVAMIAQGDLNSAALTLEQALILSEAEPVPPELDSLWGNLGLLAFKAGRFADAAELWQRAAEEAEARNLSPSLYHSNLARLYLSQGRDGE